MDQHPHGWMPRYSLCVRELAESASLQSMVMPGFPLGCDGGFIEGLEPSVMADCTELCFVSLESLLGCQTLSATRVCWCLQSSVKRQCCKKQLVWVWRAPRNCFSVKVDRGCPCMRALNAIQCVQTSVSTYRDQRTEVKGKRNAEAMTQSPWKSAGISFFART